MILGLKRPWKIADRAILRSPANLDFGSLRLQGEGALTYFQARKVRRWACGPAILSPVDRVANVLMPTSTSSRPFPVQAR